MNYCLSTHSYMRLNRNYSWWTTTTWWDLHKGQSVGYKIASRKLGKGSHKWWMQFDCGKLAIVGQWPFPSLRFPCQEASRDGQFKCTLTHHSFNSTIRPLSPRVSIRCDADSHRISTQIGNNPRAHGTSSQDVGELFNKFYKNTLTSTRG